MRGGEHPREASWKGTHEVGVVVIFGVLTTDGRLHADAHGQRGERQDLAEHPADRHPDAAVLAAAVEAGPARAPRPALRPSDPTGKRRPDHAPAAPEFADGLESFVERVYQPVLTRRAAQRATSSLSLFSASAGRRRRLVAHGWIKIAVLPGGRGATSSSPSSTLPNGVPFETRPRRRCADRGRRLKKLGERYSATKTASRSCCTCSPASAASRSRSASTRSAPQGGHHLGEVTIELRRPATARSAPTNSPPMWRETHRRDPRRGRAHLPAPRPPAAAMPSTWTSPATTSTSSNAAVAWVKEHLGQLRRRDRYRRQQPRRQDARSDSDDLIPPGEALGLRLDDVARQVREAFYGDEVQRLQRGRDEVKVMVRYPRGRTRARSRTSRR